MGQYCRGNEQAFRSLRMKILIATGIFPPDIGGPATYGKTIAEEFSRLQHEITVVTYGAGKMQDARYKIQAISHRLPKGVKHAVYFLTVLWQGRNAKVIFAQDPVSAGLPALLAAFLLRRRFVLKIVGDYAWEQGMQRFCVGDLLDDFLKKRYGFRVEALRFLERFVARSADRILVPSEYLKGVVIQWGIRSERVFVVYNAVDTLSVPVTALSAVDTPPVTVAREEVRARLGLGLYEFVLLAAGRLVPWKGFAMLIDFLPRLQKKIPDVQLIIVGSGPEKENLESRIMNHGVQEYVRLTGSLSKDHLVLYMKAADVFLLNTGYEGFSHQLIEAMAMGIPIITTDAGGNKEIIRDGENVLVAEYDDSDDWEEKVLQLYEDRVLREKLRDGGKDTSRQYSLETMVRKTESVLRGV